MFSFNKTIICVEFTKTSVFCALAQITGRKVDIIAIDSIQVDGGILEEGIIYDAPHLQHLVQNLITSVSKTYNKIDAAWIAIPDNKVLITKFEVEKDKKGIDEDLLNRAVEEKFNYSASKLYLINRPIHEINRRVFFISNAIRIDNLEPFVELFKPLNIPVESVFPTFQCIFEEVKDQFTVPTLFLYPANKGYKFFLGDANGVYLESVWGHNVIEFNENFDKAIDEIVNYAKQSKEVALGVKKIVVVETDQFNSDTVQMYLQKTGIDFSWLPTNKNEESGFDPISILILKGMIKASMGKDFSKGFFEPQMTHEYEPKPLAQPITPLRSVLPTTQPETKPLNYITPLTKNTVISSAPVMQKRWNLKVIIGSIVLALLLIGSLAFLGVKLADRANKSNLSPSTSDSENQVSPTPTETSTPTPTVVLTITPTTSPTAETKVLTKKDVTVQVLNGNNIVGEASRINGILKNNQFQTKQPANAATKNVQTTTITYKDPGAKALADEIVKLIEPSYPSAKAVQDSNSTEDILVLLGMR